MLITKTNQPLCVFRDAAYFFGKIRIKISKTIWMMLFWRSGLRAIISEAAHKAMAIIAEVAGSMGFKALAIAV